MSMLRKGIKDGTKASPKRKRKRYRSRKPQSYRWDYDKKRKVGQGTYGEVFEGYDHVKAKTIAVKIMDVNENNKESLRETMKEIDVLSSLHHENIVDFEGYQLKDNKLFIFMEYAPGGSVRGQIDGLNDGKSKQVKGLNVEIVRRYAKDILKGLAYIHSENVVHGDIKCDNILLCSSSNTCKLADFGTAMKLMESKKELDDLVGSVYWMAPEIITQTGIDYASDIWSFGATVYEMIMGNPPFYEEDIENMSNQFKVMHKIAGTMQLPIFDDKISQVAQNFVYRCMK